METRPSAALKQHVPALDGIRAVGMAAMLLYHGQVGSKGAFLALSQFFTLSGFLVMSILLRRMDDPDGLQVRRFWGRRYRRLLPASLLTLAGVLVYGFTLATEQQVEGLRTSIPAALGQVVNWHFVLTDASYVDLFSSPSPIQHFWSLAIEEQFYLLTPILLLGVLRLSTNPRVLAIGFAVAAVASSVWMWWLFGDGASIDRLYYGTDTRASEMLLGCLLAILLHHWRPSLRPQAQRALGLAGLLAYGVSLWAFFSVSLTDARMYRGGFLVFSLLTCVVIFSLVEEVGPTRRVLALPPLAALGRITYGIYLFHWPLMLTLTEDRTGLDGWWLFSLQVTVTVVLAALSAKFFEAPIRYGRAQPRDFRFPIAIGVAGLALAVAGLALQLRDVETELAGLGEAAGEAPVVGDQGPVRVVAIGDDAGLAFVTEELEPADAGSDRVEIVATASFACIEPTSECGDTQPWTNLVAQHDPDIVLLHVSAWEGRDLFELSGAGDLAETTEWARERFGVWFDALGANGATIAWARGPATFADGVRGARDPFILAMTELTSGRANARRLGVVDDPQRALDDLELYARKDADTRTRVMVVGDSVSRTIGWGLERWADARGSAIVWSAGTEGCGVARGGFFVDTSGRETAVPALCDSITDAWANQIRDFDPELVIVVSGGPDFRERRIEGWPERLEPGDARFDDYLVDEYVRAVDVLSAGGANVTWVIPPCATDAFGVFREPDGGNALDIDRIRYVRDEIIPRVVDVRADLETFDLYEVMCPDDVAINSASGVDNIRPDGVHFSSPGSLWLAETIGDALLSRPQS